MDFAARIAPEIDRLVLSVARSAADRSAGRISEMATELGLDSPYLLKHYAEFLLAGKLTDKLALRRLPYRRPHVIFERLDRWRDLGLIHGPPEALRSGDDLAPLLRSILDARAAAARELWSQSTSFEPALELSTTLACRIPDTFALARAHRALPEPEDRYLRLHHLLTSIRFVRTEAHTQAWRHHGLDQGQIVALTMLWRDDTVEVGPGLERIVERGLAFPDGSGLTVAGIRIRHEIEDQTNHIAQEVFDALDPDDREDLLVALAQLPHEPS